MLLRTGYALRSYFFFFPPGTTIALETLFTSEPIATITIDVPDELSEQSRRSYNHPSTTAQQ